MLHGPELAEAFVRCTSLKMPLGLVMPQRAAKLCLCSKTMQVSATQESHAVLCTDFVSTGLGQVHLVKHISRAQIGTKFRTLYCSSHGNCVAFQRLLVVSYRPKQEP